MKIAIAVFVKTPGLSPVKTRLAETIGRVPAERIYLRSVAITREIIEGLRAQMSSDGKSGTNSGRDANSSNNQNLIGRNELVPYWAVAESLGVTHRLWSGWHKIEQGSGDLGERLAKVYSELRSYHDIVCLYGADSPHISSARLSEGLSRITSGRADVVVGPAEDGGFYFFASSLKLPATVWTGVPYSTSETLSRLRERIEPLATTGWSNLPLEFDIDTDADYKRASIIEPRLAL